MTAEINFGKTAADYAKFRAGFPERFFRDLRDKGHVRASLHVLDIGTGTGTVARGMARMGCETVGMDPSADLIAEAKTLDRAVGVGVSYELGRAEDIPFPDHSFDLVTAGQCWHWFDAARAKKEIARVLRPGGTLIIAYFDWIPSDGNVIDLTEKLIEIHNPSWTRVTQPGFFRRTPPEISSLEGFHMIEEFSFELSVPYSHEAWRGRVRASAAMGAQLPPEEVAKFDAALGESMAAGFPETILEIPHRVWARVLKVLN